MISSILRGLTARLGKSAAKWAACLLATVSISSAWAEEINVIDVPELTVTTLDPADDSLDWRGQLTPINVALHYELSADVLAVHQEQLAEIADWKIDWVLTSSEDLTLVNPRTALPSGMTLEQVDASSEGGCISGKISEASEWVYAPLSSPGVFQLSANTGYRVYNQIVLGGGSSEIWLDASSFVQNKGFGCALYLTTAYRMAHPNVVITLQPYLYHPSDSSVRYSLGEAKRFTFGLPDAPKAVVTKNAAYNKEVNLVNVNDILSGGYQYGTVTPNVAYTFEAKDTPEEASSGAYSNWKCDYVVSMDADTDAYSIGLYGQYGSWMTVAFPSPVKATAGQKIPLLMSVTKNGWNYSDIVNMVRSFTCGAINFSEENIGKAITVSLVMWNEDNPVYKSYENPYVVEEIKYKFETVTPLFASVSQGAPAVPVVYRKNTADEYGFSVDEDGYPVTDDNGNLFVRAFAEGEPHFAMVADNTIAKTSDSSYSTADEAVATVEDDKEITVNISTSIGSEAAPAGSTVTTTTGTAVTAGTDSTAETTVTPKTVTITSGTGSEQTVKTVEAYVVSQGSGEDKKFSVVTDVRKDETIVSAGKTVVSDFVKPAEVIAKVVASENLEADKVSSMVLSLAKTETESSEPELDSGLAAAIEVADKAFEVHPVATITTTTEEGTTSTVSYDVKNGELADNASFTFTLDFGVENAGKLVTLTHYASDGVIKQHNGKDSWTESLDANGIATVTLSEFSYLLGTVLNAFTYNDFVEALYNNNGSFDGSAAAYADLPKDENGRLIVPVDPVGGSWSAENCTATWSTPYRLNDGAAQLQLFHSMVDARKGKSTTGVTDVAVKNVAFIVSDPASGEVTGGYNDFNLSAAKAYQLYLMNDGNVTFDNCEFDGVGLAVYPSEEKENVYTRNDNTTIIKDCSFANIYDYAIKQVCTPNYYVTGTTFENCGCAMLVYPLNGCVNDNNITTFAATAAFVGNTFTNVDAGKTWGEKNAGGSGTVKFDIRNNGTTLIWGDNTVNGCSDVEDTEYHFRKTSNNVTELKTATGDTHTISYVSDNTPFATVKPGTVTVNEDGTVLWEQSSVAQIVRGGNVVAQYESLAAAFEAAQDGDTVQLLADIEFEDSLDIASDEAVITLDLGGKKLSAADGKVANDKFTANSAHDYLIGVKYGSILQIVDSVGGGEIDGSNLIVALKLTTKGETPADEEDCAALVVGSEDEDWNDFTISGDYYGISGNGTRHQTSLEVFGGTIQSVNESEGTGIYQPQNGSLLIQGGTIKGHDSAVEVRAGDVSIWGGTYVVTGDAAYSSDSNGNGTTAKGAAIAIAPHTTGQELIVQMLDGGDVPGESYTFTIPEGAVRLGIANPENADLDNADITIVDPEEILGSSYSLPEGYDWYYANDLEVWGLNLSVAERLDENGDHIGNYRTLADAVAEAQSGETIKLLADVAEPLVLERAISVVLNLNGKRISVESSNALGITSGVLTVLTEVDEDGYATGSVEGSIAVSEGATLNIRGGIYNVDWTDCNIEGTIAVSSVNTYYDWDPTEVEAASAVFTSAVPYEYCAEGFIPGKYDDIYIDGEFYYYVKEGAFLWEITDADGKVAYSEDTPQAEDDEELWEYDWFVQHEMNRNGFTMKLLQDVPASEDEALSVYVSGLTYTVDLNRHTVERQLGASVGECNVTIVNGFVSNAGGKAVAVGNGAQVTLGDGFVVSEAVTGVYVEGATDTEASSKLTVLDGAEIQGTFGILVFGSGPANPVTEVVVNGGEITGTTYGISGNGTIEGDDDYSNTRISISGGSVTGGDVGIYHPQAGTLSVSGGEITGGTAIYAKSGAISVTGGELSANASLGQYDASYAEDGPQQIGDALVLDCVNYPGGNPTANITAGYFLSANGKGVGSYAATGVTAVSRFASGGYYSSMVSEDYCVPGYICTTAPMANGYYQVVPKVTVTFALGENPPDGATAPEALTYPSGNPVETVLPMPTYTATDKTFGGWKVKDSDPEVILSALPAGTTGDVTLTATWIAAGKVEVEIGEDSEAAKVEVVIPDDFFEGKKVVVGEEEVSVETPEQKSAYLETPENNGIKVWQNYVMGIDGSESSNSLAPIGGEPSSERIVVVKTPVETFNPPKSDTGVTVKYALYWRAAGSDTWTQYGDFMREPTFNVDIVGDVSAAETYWKIEAVFTASSVQEAESCDQEQSGN